MPAKYFDSYSCRNIKQVEFPTWSENVCIITAFCKCYFLFPSLHIVINALHKYFLCKDIKYRPGWESCAMALKCARTCHIKNKCGMAHI